MKTPEEIAKDVRKFAEILSKLQPSEMMMLPTDWLKYELKIAKEITQQRQEAVDDACLKCAYGSRKHDYSNTELQAKIISDCKPKTTDQ